MDFIILLIILFVTHYFSTRNLGPGQTRTLNLNVRSLTGTLLKRTEAITPILVDVEVQAHDFSVV